MNNETFENNLLKKTIENTKNYNDELNNKNCLICCNHIKNGIILEPFMHQVGGHNIFLTYKPNSLCKVFHQDEYLFYKHMSPLMNDFIPKLNVNVHQCKNENEEICYVATICNEKDVNILENQILENNFEFNNLPIKTNSFERIKKEKKYHPWYYETKVRFDQKWKKYNYGEKIFMLLENVTFKFQKPCVLDLKIGFRAHGDKTHPEKIKRKIQRCETTTTCICGIRLCGLQTYHVKTDSSTFIDKYQGRLLNMEQLYEKLYEYFFDGENYRYQFIKPFINRLKNLIEILNNVESLRLYATSVLLVYDGNLTEEELKLFSNDDIKKHFDIKLIDFAQASYIYTNNINDEPKHIGPDQSFILGINNLCDIFEKILKDKTLD